MKSVRHCDFRSRGPRHETGAILGVSLLLLLVLTLLGITAMQMTRMEERMAGNLQDSNVAFQGAEAGLREAEETLRSATTRPAQCVNVPCATVIQRGTLVNPLSPPDPIILRDQTADWWDTNGRLYTPAATMGTTRRPRFIVEDDGFIPDSLTVGHGPPEGRNFYRVTSHSPGASETARAVVESTYTKRF